MSIRNTVKSIQDIMRQDTGVDGDAQRISQLCWMFFLKIIDDQDQELELMSDDYTSPIPDNLQWRSWAADPEGITGQALLDFVNNDLFNTLKDLSVTGASRRRVVRDVFEDAYNYMKSGQLMRQIINKINAVDFNNLAERQHFGDIYEQILNDLQNAGNSGEYYTPRAVTAFMADRIDPKPGEILFDPAVGTGGFLTCSIRQMRERYVKTAEDEAKLQSGLRAVEKKQLPHMLCMTNMLLHGIENPSFVRHDNTLARPYISYTKADRVDVVLSNPPFGGREEDGIESNFPQHFRTKETADLFLALIIRLLKKDGRIADAPDSIPRLRRFILDLAVRGKLVEQDSNDEPAAELLKRIAAEKERLVAEKKIKKPKALPPIEADQVPFEIPDGWAWERLGNLVSYLQRGKSPKYSTDSGIYVVSQKCVQWSGLQLEHAKQITAESMVKYEEIRFIQEDDLLWNSTGTGTIGRVIRITNPPKKLVTDSHVTVVRLLECYSEYIRSWLCTDDVYGAIEGNAAGSTNQVELTASLANGQPTPLPPLAEQKRIVAKVTELMALCDRLEAAQAERNNQRNRLVAATHHQINTPESDPKAVADFLFHQANFTKHTARPEHIKQLRQTILNLAVRGKLVEQDPNDEPAINNIAKPDDKIANWVSGTVRDFIVLKSGNTLPKEMEQESAGQYLYLKVGDMNIDGNDPEIVTSSRTVDPDAKMLKGLIPKNSIIFPKRGGAIATNKKRMVRSPIFVDSNTMTMTCPDFIELRYLQSWFMTVDLWALNSGTSVPQINNKDIYPIKISLPPLAEQKRIVAKVDELMALCDALEAQLTSAQTESQQLLEACLNEAIA